MTRKKLEKAFKAISPYLIAFLVGLILWWACTPYAQAHRADPSLIGGEASFPLLAILAVALFKSFMEIKELRRDSDKFDDKDY